jgi:hypothetical protein
MGSGSSGSGQRQLVISVIDGDPLRARSDARELLAEVVAVDSTASLRLPSVGASAGTDKGSDILGDVGLVLSAGSLAASCVQVWLAKVPQRTIVVSRPDGATLRITGREAREDEERVAHFLSGDALPADGEKDADADGADASARRSDTSTAG